VIQVYINGSLRSDIIVHTGGSLVQNGEHKTSSRVTVTMPADSTNLYECDHIRFTDGALTVFAGTILGLPQRVVSHSDWATKTYEVVMTSNADYIANVFVDLNFPTGANITQIIRGNHSGQSWYESGLGDFFGIYERRISVEGITLGTMDNFTAFDLEDSATLWGTRVTDVLDDLCAAASAWWEITSDKVFNMRYDTSRTEAPIVLSPSAEVFDLQPSRDAYTLYSACRVFGGKGKGEAIQASNTGVKQAVLSVSANTITLKYPIHAFGVWDAQSEGYLFHLMLGDYSTHYVGVQGIHDNNSSYHFLYSVGSTSVTAKSGYTFLPAGGDGSVILNYYRQVDIAARLYDPDLVAEIVAQRGGFGIIEYTISDASLITFRGAINAAYSFLKTHGRRSSDVKFKTFTSGFAAGQLITTDEMEYYNILGNYEITSVEASTVRLDDTSIVWQYAISASTVPYRDKTKTIFKTTKKATFQLGDNSPAATGVMLKNEIKITTTIKASAVRGQTWTVLEAQYSNWTTFKLKFTSWKIWDDWIKEWNYTGNYLTQAIREDIARIFRGSSTVLVSRNVVTDVRIGVYPSSWYALTVLAAPGRNGNTINAIYLVPESQYLTSNTPEIFVEHASDNIKLMSIKTKIDKLSASTLGNYQLIITKKDVIT